MTEASVKVGGLRPTSLQFIRMCLPWVLMVYRSRGRDSSKERYLKPLWCIYKLKWLNENNRDKTEKGRQIYLYSRPRSLSPTLTSMTSLPAPESLAISLFMALATLLWMAPQRPRSDDTPMIKCLFLSSGALSSAFSYRAKQQSYERNNITRLSQDGLNEYQNICALILRIICCIPIALVP